MADPFELSSWRSRIEQAVGYHARQHTRWRAAHRILLGDWETSLQAVTDPDYTPVNYAKAYVSAVQAAIYARNPNFLTRSRTARYTDFAYSMEQVLNYFRDDLNLKHQVKRMIPDALITGISWMDVGYTATFGQLDLQPQDDGGLFSRLLKPDPKRPAQQGVLNEYVKEISPFAVRLSPWNVYLAPGYHSVHEMPYLLVAEDLAPEDLAAHPLYSAMFGSASVYPSKRIEIPTGPSVGAGMARGYGAERQGAKLTAMYRLWHIWDRRGNCRYIWLDGSQEVAGPFPWNLAIEGFPQVPMIFNDLPETDREAHGYPVGDLTFLAPQLKELNRLRTQMVRHRKRSGGTILAQKTGLTDEQARKLQQSGDLDLVLINGNPSTDVHTFTPAPLSSDVYQVGAQIMADLDLIGQLPFLIQSSVPGKQPTATRDALVAQGGNTIRSEKVDVIEEVMKEVGKRLAAVIWEYLPRSVVQEILGEERLPEELWPSLPEDREARRDMIERELQFTIEAGSTQPLKDKTLKNEQKIRLLNILGGIAPERIKITSDGLGKLVDDFEMPELREWMVLDDAAELKAIEQENQLLAQGIPQVVSPNEQHQLHEHHHAALVMSPQTTPAAEEHLLAHRQFRQAKQPRKPAQAGDGGATRGTAANPEQQRKGIGDLADLMGLMTASQSQPGTEQGGNANV